MESGGLAHKPGLRLPTTTFLSLFTDKITQLHSPLQASIFKCVLLFLIYPVMQAELFTQFKFK